MFCLHVCMYTMCMQCSNRPPEGMGYSGTCNTRKGRPSSPASYSARLSELIMPFVRTNPAQWSLRALSPPSPTLWPAYAFDQEYEFHYPRKLQQLYL